MRIEDAEAVRSSWVSPLPSPNYARLTVHHNWREEIDGRLVLMGSRLTKYKENCKTARVLSLVQTSVLPGRRQPHPFHHIISFTV